MPAPERDLIPWCERAFVTVAEASQIVARSPDWIRNRIGEGRLSGARLTPGGPAVVCVPSLRRLIGSAVPISPAEVKRRAPKVRPRLVVSNP